MTMTTLERIESYRNRAEELRMIAEGMESPVNRQTMEKIAQEYLDMAQRLESESPPPPLTINSSAHPIKS